MRKISQKGSEINDVSGIVWSSKFFKFNKVDTKFLSRNLCKDIESAYNLLLTVVRPATELTRL